MTLWTTFLQFQGVRWVFTICVALMSFLIGQFGTPYCKAFHWDDESINMPFAAQEIFPNWSLVLIVAVPIGVQGLVIFFLPRKNFMFPATANTTPRRQLLLELNSWALIQIQALMLQLMFVDTMKLYAGRLRPDFLDRLRSVGLTAETGLQYHCELMSNSVVRQGRLSFPSGHSSTSFAAMVPFTIFLMHYFRPWLHGCIIRLVLSLLPLYLAFFVAVSRTRDNRHHFADILAGSIIGVFAAFGAFLINLKYSGSVGNFDPRMYGPASMEEGILHVHNQEQQQHQNIGVIPSFGATSQSMRAAEA
ncbi:phosphatidic acid phosphatase, putative [Bodo saltans]|uniref:Phosphatidic acid phosphatase, putative n=1 Tax=Bodo saltans TaxID=75058 RepID=A0A0S4JH63_BODSA|nr:phosphatidic acid phosphatase, putative [Bodo saltans]|eukprot:CUG88794.1 phosphatidic acid phosphatase, putative [Bodo saltans]